MAFRINIDRGRAKRQKQEADDKTFNRLVTIYGMIPKADVASQQSILNQISEQSDGQIPKMNLEQGATVMSILKPTLEEHKKGIIDKNEVLSRIGVLGLERPTKAAGLEKFATGFEERGTTRELQQAEAIAGLPEEQFVAGGGERAITELRGMSEEGRKILEGEKKAPVTKVAANYRLPNGEIVLSRDGGQTYTDVDGTTKPLPSGTIKVPGAATLAEVTASGQREQAKEELEVKETKESADFRRSAEEAAELGTGPYANLKAGFNAVAGGLGLDRAFGLNGFFPDTQKSRQFLRLVKQTSKEALLNSARGAIWEQQKIEQLLPNPDKFWLNPDTEVDKIPLIREVFNQEKQFNLQAITTATPKEITKLRESNLKLDRVLNLIGTQAGQPTGQPFNEGATASDGKGNTIVFREGRWQPK